MPSTRRDFVVTSLAALAAVGCQTGQSTTGGPAATPWPTVDRAPTPGPAVVTPRPATPTPQPAPADPVQAISRTSWTSASMDHANINPMNGVNRITIHHDGLQTPLASTSYQASREYLELIRRSHRGRGWADIGYHYAIDKAGRIWVARPVQYQGAHVKDQNEHNIGVIVLGNFNTQQPTEAQLSTLAKAVGTLRRSYKIAGNRIYTHRELNPTSCPGSNLQPRIVAMRSRNMFA